MVTVTMLVCAAASDCVVRLDVPSVEGASGALVLAALVVPDERVMRADDDDDDDDDDFPELAGTGEAVTAESIVVVTVLVVVDVSVIWMVLV